MTAPRALLRLLHTIDVIERGSGFRFWSQRSTDEIVESLRAGSPYGQLEVKQDGTVMQGNTRIHILRQRRYDVEVLPRVLYIPIGSSGPTAGDDEET